MPLSEYAREQLPGGTVTLTDLAAEDIAAIIHFWYAGGADHPFLGIDPLLLGSPGDTEKRFRNAIRSGDPGQSAIAFAIRLDQEIIGYTLLNRHEPEINYSHWHIMKTGLRGSGISTALYPYRIRMYFELFPITRLIHQTRTRNIAVNRLLDKFLPVAETGFVAHPDGVALPGEFHTRYVMASDLPGIFLTAAEIKRGSTG